MKAFTPTRNRTRISREDGFTFIELIMVIVMIGILASVALQKMITTAEQAELTAEDMTIDTLRANLVNNFGQDLVQGKVAKFPEDPFTNLSKVPEGYDRRRSARPSGESDDNGVWMFDRGAGVSGNLTPEDTGTTLTDFVISGFIYHQRKDKTIVKWPYDQINGVVGKKSVQTESDIKKQLDQERRLRGEPVEGDKIIQTR